MILLYKDKNNGWQHKKSASIAYWIQINSILSLTWRHLDGGRERKWDRLIDREVEENRMLEIRH